MTQHEINNIVNEVIGQINALIRKYSFPGIILILIGFGLVLLLLTYLPYIVGLLLLVLIGWFIYQRL